MSNTTPWDDCKVAFSVDTIVGDDELFSAIEVGVWPEGWEFTESDGSGARLVLIFRVEGSLREIDGRRVRRQIGKILRQFSSVSTEERP